MRFRPHNGSRSLERDIISANPIDEHPSYLLQDGAVFTSPASTRRTLTHRVTFTAGPHQKTWRVLTAVSALTDRNTSMRLSKTSVAQIQTLKTQTIKRKTLMNNPKIIFTSVLLALACSAASPMALGRPLPTPTPTPTAPPPLGEDRGNGNSAGENIDALSLSTTGINNTAHGWSSLYRNTTGNFNTAYGNQALYYNTTGDGNTATGSSALFLNTSG